MSVARRNHQNAIPESRAGAVIVGTALDLLFPPACLLCRREPPPCGDRFCPACGAFLEQESGQEACPTCAKTVGPFEVSEGRCRECRGRRLPVEGVARVADYRGEVGRLVRAYKYRGREEIATVLADWMASAVRSAEWADSLQVVVPVPTHWLHRYRRPLHAADRLAEELARRLELPMRRYLKRTRAGLHQVGLPVTQRLENVRGAFALRPRRSVKGLRVLLVDDVRTTGATLRECGYALREGGAETVHAVVVCRAERGTHAREAPGTA